MAIGSVTGARTLGTISEDGSIRNGMQMACDLHAASLIGEKKNPWEGGPASSRSEQCGTIEMSMDWEG